ncbi:MAG TPA: sulfotransferase [Allosphingosinicella sp.]|nr:sulfotransferase [Allosphingosinicella sp.]
MSAAETPAMLLARAGRLREAGRVEEAIAAYEAALAAAPEAANAWYNLGWLQRRARRFDAALAAYSEAIRRGVEEPEEVHLNRAVIFADHLARPDEAQAELEAALALNPAYVPALLNLGNLAEDRGERSAARTAYERALAAEPANKLALARLAGVSGVSGADDPLLTRLREALADPAGTAEDKADLGFALGRALDAAGAYDEAFAAYAQANRASWASLGTAFRGYDAAAAERFIDALIEAFPQPSPPSAAGGEPPLFICGMFRSGSTLAEQILARHRRVTPGGELDLLPALIARDLRPYPQAAAAADESRIAQLRDAYLSGVRAAHTDAGLVTDKRPDNFLHVGLIKRMFPGAKIVHTVRNPLDNCLSVWFLHLDPGMTYAFDLADTAHWYRQQQRLMAHWKRLYPDDVFDLDYDALVADPEPAIRRLLAFCGLEWDEACLSFHAGTNPVKTASAWQVREPLYRRASGRWHHYEKHLGALRRALGEPLQSE